jgi:hypothetical protein
MWCKVFEAREREARAERRRCICWHSRRLVCGSLIPTPAARQCVHSCAHTSKSNSVGSEPRLDRWGF